MNDDKDKNPRIPEADAHKDNESKFNAEENLSPTEQAIEAERQREAALPPEEPVNPRVKAAEDAKDNFEEARDAEARRNETPASNLVHSEGEAVAAYNADQIRKAELVHGSEQTPNSTYGGVARPEESKEGSKQVQA